MRAGRASRTNATRPQATVQPFRAMPETLYYPLFTDSRERVPVAHQAVFPLTGCHFPAVTGTGGRPRIIAFGTFEAAKAAIPLLKAGGAPYEVGPRLQYRLDKPGDTLDLVFVHGGSALQVGNAIGSHMCDVCMTMDDGQLVVLSSWSVDVERDVDRFRISIPRLE